MAIFPLAPDQTIAQMWSMEFEGEEAHVLDVAERTKLNSGQKKTHTMSTDDAMMAVMQQSSCCCCGEQGATTSILHRNDYCPDDIH